MGVLQEMMFSYSWKVEEDNIRTLARAVWSAGVGVWIDVVKLCASFEKKTHPTHAPDQSVSVFFLPCFGFFWARSTPGDEIQPVLRTVAHSVRQCVVFLSPGMSGEEREMCLRKRRDNLAE